jgi:hypothetical protein
LKNEEPNPTGIGYISYDCWTTLHNAIVEEKKK